MRRFWWCLLWCLAAAQLASPSAPLAVPQDKAAHQALPWPPDHPRDAPLYLGLVYKYYVKLATFSTPFGDLGGWQNAEHAVICASMVKGTSEDDWRVLDAQCNLKVWNRVLGIATTVQLLLALALAYAFLRLCCACLLSPRLLRTACRGGRRCFTPRRKEPRRFVRRRRPPLRDRVVELNPSSSSGSDSW